MTSMRIFRAAQVATIVLAGLAMAACVLLASAFGIRAYLVRHDNMPIAGIPTNPAPTDGSTPTAIVQITGPEIEQSPGSSIAQISIGAGPNSAGGDSPDFAEGIVARSPRSLIATSASSAQDYSQGPF